MILIIAQEFSEMPGARNRNDGAWSGQEFREDILGKRFVEASSKHEKLIVNMDGTYGYATSFLEEAFGGLARQYGVAIVQETLDFVSEDEPGLIEEIRGYISNAERSKK